MLHDGVLDLKFKPYWLLTEGLMGDLSNTSYADFENAVRFIPSRTVFGKKTQFFNFQHLLCSNYENISNFPCTRLFFGPFWTQGCKI